LFIIMLGTPQNGGTATINNDNTVKYVPPVTTPPYSGTDSFSYTVSDWNNNTSQATITVTMNSPPTAMADSETNSGSTAIYSDLLSNDTDPDNADRPNFRITSPGATAIATAHGGSVSSADGLSVSYTPPPLPFYGVDTFSYTMNDGYGAPHASSATVSVTVSHALSAQDDIAQVLQNNVAPPQGTFDPRLNDSGDNVKIKSADHHSAAGGTVTVNGTSTITYVAPSAGFMGPDNFNYAIKDTYGNTATANVQVTIVSGGN
jgi:hypothetical protein